MEWLDKVYLAKYDEHENTIDKLKPFESGRHFFEDELNQIEQNLEEVMNMNE
jgi:hypothetical protein